MKKILIIYPHFPPSNLAGVHRPRLFAQHLPAFGWEPIVLTVHEEYYEEKLDYNLEKLLPATLRIEKVNAFKITKPRLIGDIGLRGFFSLYKRARQIIQAETIEFVFIPIPSFYTGLLGRWLHTTTGVQYGIDYIDPWVHTFPGSNRLFSRHWFSTALAKFLEPIAVKKAALITGVAAGYYQGVTDRNPLLLRHAIFGAMPYGGEQLDHEKLASLDLSPYLFAPKKSKTQLVYAGAMLPKAYKPLTAIFEAIRTNPETFKHVEIIFIGTGKRPNDPTSFNIKPLAQEYGLWESVVFEFPQRIPYLDVLTHLTVADGIFVLGSTESHYTPSKVYQGVLSGKPILAVLHVESTANEVIEKSGVGKVLAFNGEQELTKISATFDTFFRSYLLYIKKYLSLKIDTALFDQYSAHNVTGVLAALLDKVTDKNRGCR